MPKREDDAADASTSKTADSGNKEAMLATTSGKDDPAAAKNTQQTRMVPPNPPFKPTTGFGLALVLSAALTLLSTMSPYPPAHICWPMDEGVNRLSLELNAHGKGGGIVSLRDISGKAMLGLERGDERWGGDGGLAAERLWISLLTGDGGCAARGTCGAGRKAEGSERAERERDVGEGGEFGRGDGPQKGRSGQKETKYSSFEPTRNSGKEGVREIEKRRGQTRRTVSGQAEANLECDHALRADAGRITIGLNFSLIPSTGWGNLAYALFLGSLNEKCSALNPILLQNPHPSAYHQLAPGSAQIKEILQSQRIVREGLLEKRRATVPVLHAVDHMYFDETRVRGEPNIAFIFFDTFVISKGLLQSAAERFDCIVVGSEWNAKMLRLRGLPESCPIYTAIQGVDTNIFYPSDGKQQRPEKLKGRFVIFSGGKFELRKGQDIVVAAFREFTKRNPKARALLLFSWNNPWPIRWYASLGGGEKTQGVPQEKAGGGHDFLGWLKENGVEAEDVLDLGMQSQEGMATAMRWADVALFPNRCEGGTNLVAMEAMASGIPTILSNNSGHTDLTKRGRRYTIPLEKQQSIAPEGGSSVANPYEGWGESDVGECVSSLERVWRGGEDVLLGMGRRAAGLMDQNFSWGIYRRNIESVVKQCSFAVA